MIVTHWQRCWSILMNSRISRSVARQSRSSVGVKLIWLWQSVSPLGAAVASAGAFNVQRESEADPTLADELSPR